MTEPKPRYDFVPAGRPIRAHVSLAAELAPASNRREFTARLVSAGRIRRADDSPGNFIVTESAITQAVDAGMFDSLAVFADHPGFFQGPSVKSLIGVTKHSAYNPLTESADATIRFYNTTDNDTGETADPRLANVIADTLAMMIEDSEDGTSPPDVGVSLVFWPEWEDSEGFPKTLRRFRKIDSADIVFGPAADGRILEALSVYTAESAATAHGGNNMPEQLTTETAEETEDQEEQEVVQVNVTPAPNGDQARAQATSLQAANDWQDAAGQEAARVIVNNSQLPEISRDRLLQQHWTNPDEVYNAIDTEREYLANLTQANVITLRGMPPRALGNLQMTTGLDQFQNAVEWIFGAPEASTPEPQLRRLDMVYSMLTGDYDFHGVFHPDRVFLAGADTGTLANMAANAMNKVIIAQLALLTYYRWYEMIATPTPNDGSLHAMAWTSFGGVATLPIVSEGGAYDELDVDDVKESDAFAKYGGYVGITREMIKNSDIQRLQAVPRALAAASVKTRSNKIATLFTSNSGVGPTLDQDSTALFHTDHSNVATTAIGTDTTAWKAAALECFKHTEVNSGDRIGIFPKYLLVPPDLYHTALSIFGYGEGFPTSYLPFTEDNAPGDPRPVPLAVPNFTDANDWAYITDPRVWPVIHMSFSADPSGRTFPPPELWAATSETGGLIFAADTLPIKIRDEFAYGVNGAKGIGKRNVT